jgi:hypothetical protein
MKQLKKMFLAALEDVFNGKSIQIEIADLYYFFECLKRLFTCKRIQDCLGKSEEASESNGISKPEQNESSSEEEDPVLKLLNEKLQSIQSDEVQETMSNLQRLLMV